MLKFLLGIISLTVVSFSAENPYSNNKVFTPKNEIDNILKKEWSRQKLLPARRTTDYIFIRRVYLDLVGALPSTQEVLDFVDDNNKNKRLLLINKLLKSENFATYQSLRWCDTLRVKSEFPINLWPNAVQAYHLWIFNSLKQSLSYDKFAWQLLTSNGSNFRQPQVNFYRAIQGQEPITIAKAAALTFMGTRLENWKENDRNEFIKLFSRVSYKKTSEWKEEIVSMDHSKNSLMTVKLPGNQTITVKPGQDPRREFARWLIKPNNQWFARNAVNRIWFWLFGRGIVNEPDDFRLSTNPKRINYGNRPASPELLDYLAKEFVKSGYNSKHIFRLILNSSTYQQSSVARSTTNKAQKYFAVYPIKKIPAEVMCDIIHSFTKEKPKYVSVIPEPFTYIPPTNKTISLADGSITSSFLEQFGKSPRDTGKLSERSQNTTYNQRLFMLNSSMTHRSLINSRAIRESMNLLKREYKMGSIDSIYIAILGRPATKEEKEIISDSLGVKAWSKNKRVKTKKNNSKKRPQIIPWQSERDLIWTLLNTKEFVFNH